MSAATYPGQAPSGAAKAELVAAIGEAVRSGRGYAAGKLGNTERAILQLPLIRERELDPARRRAFELAVAHKALRHSGIFPAAPAFLGQFAEVYAQAFSRLDSVGLTPDAWAQNEEVLAYYGYAGQTIHFRDQEPDRSRPGNEELCYLPLFRGRRLLLVSPFAEFLCERADRQTFEAAWAKTGKPWFEPATVEPLQIPYGWSPPTWERYETALELFADIRRELESTRYDVVLIGAGLLGSLIAVAAKEQGKIGLSLGGHLQIVFGVNGSRWRDRVTWKRDYFNDTWAEIPDRYRPAVGESHENYW
ncbi:MAG TPA: hypothetical protein VH063_17170 [Gaiellaceae bacterium]|jgi:hypothetical protein|nr:hypothetical protein [Gaiellaceae bacterium]